MHLDASIHFSDLSAVPHLARAAEALGIQGLWFSEIAHDPFLGAALAAEHTTRATVGTAIALAFVRSPTSLAYLAWDLARLSGGRFVLGLGTQVRAHVERRFGMSWEHPAARLRDVVAAVRAVWRCWREGTPLRHQGPFYSLSLMTPFFTPPPFAGTIPIYLAAVNPAMCRLAGEVADGLHVHPLHSAAYLREVVLPAVDRGLVRSGRTRSAFGVAASVFIVSGEGASRERSAEQARQSIAFYASTPAYRGVLAHHGWADVGERLSRLAAAQRWEEMPALISDEMLATFALLTEPSSVADRLQERYSGLLDRVSPYQAFDPDDPLWAALARALR
ncbi:MAG: TIGR03617 family F420-dependent LLM class oxidoreductase [Armatimonadota bacterium]|nr:TIGR03617 family F420-dependent LLM class oxidoreductase [Armatimonadota bacterium]MDR7464321.1 TIGR03617 family F420-dependent LLM class oxidoreductase [Armatimonadota bacterium]MDR7468931.1 TIGR03617 family F420-dependent LLM class oxidoreductase [Armatimonadota bacterium]MDR7475029.1 TIGR03617 family F420-dependent LLM class oxidoreductase [Armatimonadota bacterium]MDR7539516.1 TIGR03617 family F420-dependent LLM class oxidoreductase [Armatimonadota bacterium]